VDFHAGVRIRTNRLGMRGPEIAPAKPDGIKRFLFLGDSVTFGVGVEEEQTFLHLVNEQLGSSVEICNGGIVSYNTVQELRWLEKWGDQIEPDAVFLLYVNNDPTTTSLGLFHDHNRTEAMNAIADELPLLKRKTLECQWNLYMVHWLKYLTFLSLCNDSELVPVKTSAKRS